MDFDALSFRTTISSFFRIYGKDNTEERRPLRGSPGQDMEKSIAMPVALFNRNKDIQVYRQNDLAVLFSTFLPSIAHDSLILKNVSDGAIDGIIKIYEKSEKPVFIAFDKQAAYTADTQAISESNCVLRLSDGNCNLYGRTWNKEEHD